MSVFPQTRVSEADFLRLPESLTKTELLDGEVIVSPSPSLWHQEILGRIILALRSWAATRGPGVVVAHAPLDVRFAPDRILQPDAMVFLGRLDLKAAGPVDRVPEICIEVLSSDRAYDRITKRFVYGGAGVTEYWIVEPAGLIERWDGPGLARAELVNDRLTSPLLPGFVLDVRSLFAQDA
jgi:Uma2 family endonuclease